MSTITHPLQVTVQCGHCDDTLATYGIVEADAPGTLAKYKWQHLTCAACKKTMGPKISIAPTPAPPAPVATATATPVAPAATTAGARPLTSSRA